MAILCCVAQKASFAAHMLIQLVLFTHLLLLPCLSRCSPLFVQLPLFPEEKENPGDLGLCRDHLAV